MDKLAGGEAERERREAHSRRQAAAEADAGSSRAVARVRLMMIISGLTTLLAVAAVLGVIGYRVYHVGGSGAVPAAVGIIALPKDARVIASTIADDRIVVTLEIAGATEIRTFDLKTLKETGRIRFAVEP
jgi:hypothetical protein